MSVRNLFTFNMGLNKKSSYPKDSKYSLNLIFQFKLLSNNLLKKPLHHTIPRLADVHGPILLLCFGSCPVLVVSSPALIDECLTTNDVAFASRPRLPSFHHLTYNQTSLIFSPYGSHWWNLQRVTTIEALSSHRLLSFSASRSHKIHSLAARLFRESHRYTTNERFGFKRVELKSSLNVVMTMVGGKRYYGEELSVAKEVREFREINKEAAALLGASSRSNFLPILRLVDLKGMEERQKRVAAMRDRFFQALIDEQRREKKEKTLIRVLLDLQQPEPQYYTDEIIKRSSQ